MSTTYIEPLISDPFEDVDEDRALHLVASDGDFTACGAPKSVHHCTPSGRRWKGEAFCSQCGRPLCGFCRLIANRRNP